MISSMQSNNHQSNNQQITNNNNRLSNIRPNNKYRNTSAISQFS